MAKPRIRVRTGDSIGASARHVTLSTGDSFQNFASQVGIGTANQLSASRYGYNPITRNRILLEWAYRGNWVAGIAVDAVAEDMTRAGIEIITKGLTTDELNKIQAALKRMSFWQNLCDTIRWARLYGGSIGVLLVEGQDPSTPLRPNTINIGQFKGIYPMDRWMLEPTAGPGELVKAMNTSLGLPESYRPIADAAVYGGQKIHYSRCVRLEGYPLPFFQKQTEMYWGISILERLYDRLVAFDSTTLGAAQLISKAHLRTISIEKLRELIAFGGEALKAVQQQVAFIRMFQTNEGITLLDASDKFEAHQYAFSGLGDMMLQFAQQVAGALQIPLVRLFGQSPAGMNATGESDFRNYYDGINASQESMLRSPIHQVLEMTCLSVLGKPLPPDTEFFFSSLWQLTPMERAEIAAKHTETVNNAFETGLIPAPLALEELRAASRITGIWSNISDDIVNAAQNVPPPVAMPGGTPEAPDAALGGQLEEPPVPTGATDMPPPESVAPVALSDPPDPASGMVPGDEDMPGDDDGDEGMEPGEVTQIDITLPNGGQVDIGKVVLQ